MKQKGVSKSTWKQCRDYISELPQEDLYKEISDACKCTEDEGKQYVADLIDNAEKYINNDNVENEILASIIPKHPEIGERYKELIYLRIIRRYKYESGCVIWESVENTRRYLRKT